MDQTGLEGVSNVRQLGGIRLRGGRQVRQNCLLRSGMLDSMTQKDRITLLEDCHLTEVIDLRTSLESSQHPDPALPGVKVHPCSILPDQVMGISREESEASGQLEKQMIYTRSLGGRAMEAMRDLYPIMVTDPHCVGKLKEFFDILLAHEDGAILWHCTVGKDRTGVTAMLLLEALGASRQDIIADYMHTNDALKEAHRRTKEEVLRRTHDEELAEQVLIIDSVDESYLNSVYETLEQKWGGVGNFLEQAMGLTAEKRELLTDKYTEPV